MTAERPFTSAIIVAAGSGTRCGGVAKPLIPLYKGKTVFSYVLEAFAACGTVDEIVVVCKDSSRFEPLLGGIPAVFAPGVGLQRCPGGERAGEVCLHPRLRASVHRAGGHPAGVRKSLQDRRSSRVQSDARHGEIQRA